MAAKESTCEESVKQIVLTEEDIPRAKLPRGTQLRLWLLCKGAKTSGKKAELVKKVCLHDVVLLNTCTHDLIHFTCLIRHFENI